MTRQVFGCARIRHALAWTAGLASLAACSDGGTSAMSRQQAAAAQLPGYACAPSTAVPGEMVCTRRGTGPSTRPAGPPARSGRLARSAALAAYPRDAARAPARPLPLTARVGVILPGLEQGGMRAGRPSQPAAPVRRWDPPLPVTPVDHAAPAPHPPHQ